MAVRPGASSKQKVAPFDESKDNNLSAPTNPNAPPPTESASSLEMAPLRPSELASRSQEQESSDDSSSERPETSDVEDIEAAEMAELPVTSNANKNTKIQNGAFALSSSGSDKNDTFRYVFFVCWFLQRHHYFIVKLRLLFHMFFSRFPLFSSVLFICRGAEAVSPAAQSATGSATVAEEQTPILRKGHSAHIRPSQINAIHDLTFGEVCKRLIFVRLLCVENFSIAFVCAIEGVSKETMFHPSCHDVFSGV